MKFLLLTYEYPPFHGGVATYLSNLMKAAPKNIEVIIDVPPKGEHWIATIWRLCLKPRRERPDLVAVSHVLPAGYVAFNSLFWYKTPYLVFTHGTDILSARKSSWKRFFMRFILQRAKFVIANSRFTAGLLREEGVTKIEIVPPGIAVSDKFQISTTLHHSRTTLIGRAKLQNNDIVSIGRLVPRKGFDTLIKTMPAVLKEVPDAHLKILGRGTYFDELDRLAHELRVEKFIDILIDASDEEKHEHLTTSALFALAARQVSTDIEGFGIVTQEASAVGLPVIVTNSGGSSEPVVDGVTGIVLPTDDIGLLADAIVGLLKNRDEANKMGAAGREYVTKEYSIEMIAKKFWALVIPKSRSDEGSQRLKVSSEVPRPGQNDPTDSE